MTIPPNLAYADATFKSTGSTTPRSHGDRAAEWVDVKDFGAVGDGVADDRAAIQAAIDVAFGTAGSPHGYANRKLNKTLYFPTTAAGGYAIGSALLLTHVYGGRILGDQVGIGITGGSTPALVVDGMVQTRITGLNFFAGAAANSCIDLNWNGTWTDLPVANTRGLNHNIVEHCLMGTAQRGIRVANGNHDGSHNSFIQCEMQQLASGGAGIELLSNEALGNRVINGGMDSGGCVAYKQTAGQFSVIQSISNGSNNAVDFQSNSIYPMTILGGRSEMNGTCISMSAGIVNVYGFNFNNGGLNMANVTGGKLNLNGCTGQTGSNITGNGGSLYVRACNFPAGYRSGYTGTVAHEF